MRIAALYDIHGNLPAMEAAVHECRREGVSAVVVGGDLAAGPMPAETLDILMALGRWAVALQGRQDRALVAAYDLLMEGRREELAALDPVVVWAAGRITDRHREYLADLRADAVLSASELGQIRFCGGGTPPGGEGASASTADDTLERRLDEVREPIVVVGGPSAEIHTAGGRRIVRPGSVGMPAEDQPGAYWALFGPDITLRRTEYDRARAARRIARSGMPGAREFAQDRVLAAPGRDAPAALR